MTTTTTTMRTYATLENFAAILKAAMTHASKDATRPHLYGVAIVDHEIIATDGHRLFCARLHVESIVDHAPAMLRCADIKVLLAAIKALPIAARRTQKAAFEFVSDDGYATSVRIVTESGFSHEIASHDDDFPPYRKVIPALHTDGGATFGVNPGYLADAAKALSTACTGTTKNHQHMQVQSGPDPLDPIRIDAKVRADDGMTECTVVVMPRRV